MKTIKLIICICLLWMIGIGVNAMIISGYCGADGNNLRWSLDEGTGILEITGSGKMKDYDTYTAPWYTNHRYFLEKVNIGNSVTSIGKNAFFDCLRLKSITIPNSVTSIGNEAFKYCTSLTSVDIPNSVNNIGDWAFFDCTGLASINFGNSVLSIGNYAFGSCESLTSISIPNSVTSIGSSAFSYCSGLTSVSIPNSVTSIGNSAFSGCSKILSITVDCNNHFFDSRDNCNAIIETSTNTLVRGCNNTIIPNSVTSIGSSAFYGCSGLISINIPNSVTSIGSSAFYYCSGLTSVSIPYSVTSIGNCAFSGCSKISSITVDCNNHFFDSRDNCNAIIETSTNTLVCGCNNTKIPNSVTSIGDSAFIDCNFTEITIPNSVTSIGSSAFYCCSDLTSVSIPNSVTSIGDNAFYYCPKLFKIYVEWNQPIQINSNVFHAIDLSKATLYVPSGTKSKYQSAEVWKNFGEIIEQPIYITKISLNKTSTEMYVGDKLTLSANITPDNATNPNIEWVSSDNSIASVSNGIVTAIGPGICSIKAKTTDGSALEVSCSIMVRKQTQSITWNQDLSTLASGGQLVELKATSSSGLHISYKSSDDNVATIFDMGFASYLSPRNVGTATITARQEGNNYYAPVEMKKVANVVQFDNVNGVHAVNGKYTVQTATGTRIGTYNESEFRKLIDSHKLSGGLYIINGEKTIIK